MSKVRARMIQAGAALLLGFGSGALQAQQAPPEAAAAAAAEAPVESRPLADFQLMLERPLFNANRRPLKEEVAGSEETSLDEQQLREVWRLTGIVLEPERQLALFSQRNGSLHLQLEVGMMLANDWVLARITEGHAELQRGDRRIEILLHDPNAPSVEPPAPPPAQAGTPAKQEPAKSAQEKGKAAEQKAKAAPAAKGTAQPAAPPKRG